MKRKTSTTPTRIWSFGALEPTENQKLLLDQLFLANRYYNTLIEIERKRRERFREIRSAAVPELAGCEKRYEQLDAQLEAILDALPKPKGKSKRKVLTPEAIAIKEELKPLSLRMKALRAIFLLDTVAMAQVALTDDEANLAIKAARAATDLYWGTYLLIERQMEQVRKSKLDPRFRRFAGEGRVGVQLQGGLSTPELLSAEDSRLRLQPRTSTPRVKKPKAQHEVRVRVGSDGRAPIWATLPVILHRPLPADAEIKWAWIHVIRVGRRRIYSLQITLESQTFSQKQSGSGTVAINFGWRANEDGSRRVAYAVDDSGNEQVFSIPASVEKDFAQANSLRSIRDLHFEEAKRALMGFAALYTKDMPEWYAEEAKFLHQWRNPTRLVRLAQHLAEVRPVDRDELLRWRHERLGGTQHGRSARRLRSAPGQDLFAPFAEVIAWSTKRGVDALNLYLELWRDKDKHLWGWEASLRRSVDLRRNELFRIWAKRMAGYAEVRMEEFDLRKMTAIPAVGEEPRDSSFRSAQRAASPGKLRERIAEACGAKVMKGAAFHNTVTCFLCSHVNERSMEHRTVCAGCGEEFDQDANNCRNQLRERPSGAPEAGGARNPQKDPVVSDGYDESTVDRDVPSGVVAAE